MESFNESENSLDFEILKRKFNIQRNYYYTYMGVKQAVLLDFRKYNFVRNEVTVLKPFVQFNIKTFVFTKKGSN